MSNGNNSLPRSALSPVSVASSEWSGISKYQSITGEQLYGGGGGGGAPETPGGGGGGGGAGTGTPPRKGSLGGLNGMNGGGPLGGRGGGGPNGSGPNNSPPPSVTRSSDGTGLYSQNDSSLQDIILEEQVATHHSALKKLLQPYLVQQGGARPNRAKDKLLRLSIIQFQELSTDVYDELQRRIAAGDRLYSPGGHAQDVRSGYLLPKDTFHPKRNQARQKLSTLPKPRFRDLATDVFYELERRYPKFSGVDLDGVSSPTGSIAGSMRGIPPPGRVGSPGPGMGPPRVGSPGPGGGGPPRDGSPGPNGTRNGPGYGLGIGSPPNGAPRLGNPTPGSHPRNMPGLGIPGMGPNGPPSGAPGGPDEFGRPMPKQFQSNTIIPNKSTMVEEDDDDGPGDDDDDEDAFGLEDPNRKSNGPGKRSTGGSLVNGGPQARRDSSRSVRSVRNGQNGTPSGSGEADKKLIAEYQNKIEILLDKVSGLESSLGEKDEEIRALRAGGGNPESNMMQQERKEWQEIRLGLEAKLEDAQNLNQSLQTEIAKVQADNAASERSLQQQLVELQGRSMNGGNGVGGTGDLGYDELLRQHEELKKDLKEQEEVTEEVRREAMEFLNQMKSLSEHTDNSWEREEKLSLEVQKLQEEVKEWKLRYARTKSTLRNLRASSMGLSLQSPTMLIGKEGGLVDPNGLVKDVNVTKFQISIDELLRVARSVNFANTLESVKAVVVATRAVTQDINESVSHNDDRVKLKSRVSATANNLITAAKNHSTGGGLSPVSLVDAAASHLTASIVELIKLVRICPTPVGELQQDDDEDLIISPESPRNFPIPPGMGGTGMGGTTTSNRPSAISEAPRLNGERSSNNSVYSPLNSPRHSQNRPRNDSNIPSWSRPSTGTGRGPAFGIRTNENNVEELRVFLETQTQGVVEAIQTLLQAIRGDGELNDFRAHVGDIATVVGKVIASTETAMSQTGNNALRDKGDWIVSNLSQCRTKMLDMTEEDEPDDGPSIKEYKSRLAGLAFEMAKQTRALVGVVEEIDNEARGVVMEDDHFR